jgi:hypothetical protein
VSYGWRCNCGSRLLHLDYRRVRIKPERPDYRADNKQARSYDERRLPVSVSRIEQPSTLYGAPRVIWLFKTTDAC